MNDHNPYTSERFLEEFYNNREPSKTDLSGQTPRQESLAGLIRYCDDYIHNSEIATQLVDALHAAEEMEYALEMVVPKHSQAVLALERWKNVFKGSK